MSNEDNKNLFDVRTVTRGMRSGAVNRQSLDKHLQSLPDVKDKSIRMSPPPPPAPRREPAPRPAPPRPSFAAAMAAEERAAAHPSHAEGTNGSLARPSLRPPAAEPAATPGKAAADEDWDDDEDDDTDAEVDADDDLDADAAPADDKDEP